MLRFAKTPSKDLTLNELQVALVTYIVSKQTNTELIIRIDDTDKNENLEGKDKEIIKTLDLFNIEYSRVILESENIKYHTGMGMKLLLDKKAFNCFCSDEVLEEEQVKSKKENKLYSYSGFCENISDETKFHCNAPFVVRLKKPNKAVEINELVNSQSKFSPDEVDSLIILSRSKTPTAHFASAVDDMLYNISTVIQKDENTIDAVKEQHIRESLGYDHKIKYISIPSFQNDQTVNSLIDQGYLPAAIANYLITIVYKDSPNEIFTVEEAVQWFQTDKISNKSILFDMEKLNSLNNHYLKEMDAMRLSKILNYADEDIGNLAKLYLKECNTIKEIQSKIDLIFTEKQYPKELHKELEIINKCLIAAPFINEYSDFLNYITTQTNLKKQQVVKPLQYLLTGVINGPELDKTYPLIKNYLGEIIK